MKSTTRIAEISTTFGKLEAERRRWQYEVENAEAEAS
jgi:hypothetical protein